ncbi:hypothetical protein QJS83_05930 [Bdellovibrio sp. 22V]|uniref:hypothetical protein n=1 Tax=Bdellovibrio TaxID=958 RepID=UPI002542F282|nr:hypothetical protein [Bdellovibrio sp. 22V]WII73407.1 hypothetical protein QJS83_05930 [Bdellovibrio sp. 22V]
MKSLTFLTAFLCAASAVAAPSASTVQHQSCAIVTNLLTEAELTQKGYHRASFEIIDYKGHSHNFKMSGVTDLISRNTPNTNREAVAKNETLARVQALHVSPKVNYRFYNEQGELLKLNVESFDSPVFSMDIPQFPKDNTQKIRFEIVVSTDTAAVNRVEQYWIVLKLTPLIENVVYRSPLFSFAEVARKILKKGTKDNDLLLIAKNDPRANDELGNFIKLFLLEEIRQNDMGRNSDIKDLLRTGIPSCQVAAN